jgi:hypothetical protein
MSLTRLDTHEYMSLTSLYVYISLTRLLISQLQETVKRQEKKREAAMVCAMG